ncbi:MAG: phytanoyl-CoA dioxygenase family protein [Alphaproteobacteria bacterium]|jgi:phytanoyl-CoA hydroxylase|nr:phytanoyl-CoA dioxygenase family protein [Alphaproteobacteria bacterium]MBT4086289.1 phytanoyl-CoA dioxygenase family protein [Alphaproteobacteria bacterium]MBT4543906.1 phytanoyl-CoA dioxygenase family protein [Alphaproteobacteria bacterium]MBT6385226.1 phytanoyl-CoA dioxygenase family protein [Alphaproteobacteria bacterium]MBT7745275.1 phytanoyl-CoA dioxygenase family protein [Alphaproteobacteria bacterium]
MTLSDEQITHYADLGHVTVTGLLSNTDIEAARNDAMAWAGETLGNLTPMDEHWYLDAGATGRHLRKLDDPVHFRQVYKTLASRKSLVDAVEQLIGGTGVTVYFSQIFFKPPEGGGPKPVHQDNFYFGPSDPDGLVTAWIALDDATVENGCLYYGDGSHKTGLIDHIAPQDEPYNLQLTPEALADKPMTAAPVPSGGVSFHHGITLHGSGDNNSASWRRAVAFHYVRNDVTFVSPAWTFDPDMAERIS